MINRAMNLGLQLAAGVVAEYGSIDGPSALDTLHESWSPLWLLPRTRTVPAGSALANSVPIRCEYDVKYRPGNLKLVNGAPDGSYPITPVVKAAPA
jgi:hypothetical protein